MILLTAEQLEKGMIVSDIRTLNGLTTLFEITRIEKRGIIVKYFHGRKSFPPIENGEYKGYSILPRRFVWYLLTRKELEEYKNTYDKFFEKEKLLNQS